MTKPSRRASNGRDSPTLDSAPSDLKAAIVNPLRVDSQPPATTASASLRATIRAASPIECAPVAHADEIEKPGPCAPSRMAIVPAAALGIIIVTKSGETARSPRSSHTLHCASMVSRPPTDDPMRTPSRSGSTPSGNPASSAACCAAATPSCVKRSARRACLGVIATSGSKSAHGPRPSAIPDRRA